jgi:ribose transport system ATP-binding protein
MSMSEYILEMKDISKSFYGVQVLNHAHLEVKHGEVHVLLGENGAGKSTLIKILSGAYRKEEGTIFIDGQEFNVSSPKEALDSGISVIYQEFNLVPHLPVYENIYMGKEFVNKGFLNKKKAIMESKRYMDMIGLDVDPTRLVSSLSVAQKQMVEIAKAISNEVKILVLDEPTASISDKETQNLFGIVRKLKEKGIGIIYISHRLSELFEIGDRVTVMRDGEYVSTVNLKDTNMCLETMKFDNLNTSFILH